MIGHDGIRQRVDGEDAGLVADGIDHPLAAVPGPVATEEGPADAARDEVVGAGARMIDEA